MRSHQDYPYLNLPESAARLADEPEELERPSMDANV
jgi:hypothetical protein